MILPKLQKSFIRGYIIECMETQQERGWLREEYAGEDEVRRASASALGVPFVILGRDDISLEALVAIPEPLARTHNIVAYRLSDGELEVALLDLDDLAAVDFLRATHNVRPRLTNRESIKRALLVYQKHLKATFAGMTHRGTAAAESLLRHALYSYASHIHIEPALAGSLVRYRIKGALHEAMRLPEEAASAIIKRLKSLAKLLPAHPSPQEGRFKLQHAGETLVVGVSSLPTAQGEKLSVQLSREGAGRKGFTLESLGFRTETREYVHEALGRRAGLLLVCGPEGSGKTTTLYTLLDLLGEPGAALATIEEKIEYALPHIAQTQTNPEAGLTMLVGLRALLRQDPDVVMIGNIDTQDVLTLAASAAERGVLVLGGVEQAELISGADLTVFVGVVQKLCPHCKEHYTPVRAELAALEDPHIGPVDFARVLAALKEQHIVEQKMSWKDLSFYRARGCSYCEGGYKGILGLQEVVYRGQQSLTLLEDGLYKAVQGSTSVEALLRAASE